MRRLARVLLWGWVALATFGFALGAAWIVGPNAWIQWLQLDLFGETGPWAATLLGWSAATLPAFWLIWRLRPRAESALPKAHTTPQARRQALVARWCLRLAGQGLVLTLAVAVIASAPPDEDAPVAALQAATPGAGETLPDRATLSGLALPGGVTPYREVLATRRGGNAVIEHLYIPVGPADWRPGQPVALFYDHPGESPLPPGGLDGPWLRGTAPTALTLGPGLVLEGALPIQVRHELALRGLTLAERHWVIDGRDRGPAGDLWLAAGILGGVSLLFAWSGLLLRARLGAEPPPDLRHGWRVAPRKEPRP